MKCEDYWGSAQLNSLVERFDRLSHALNVTEQVDRFRVDDVHEVVLGAHVTDGQDVIEDAREHLLVEDGHVFGDLWDEGGSEHVDDAQLLRGEAVHGQPTTRRDLVGSAANNQEFNKFVNIVFASRVR